MVNEKRNDDSARQESTPVRQSDIELLRIIAMIMIVAHHFAVHSGFDFPLTSISVNRLWVQFIQMGGKIGVDVFVLISGYFLITAKNFKLSKALKLWLQIFSYSILIFLIFLQFGNYSFGVIDAITRLFPITFSGWWFASAYLVMYLLFPYINRLLRTLTKQEYQKLLVLLTIIWCIVPTFLVNSLECNNLLWFVYLYALAGYIRLHAGKCKETGKQFLIISFGLAALNYMVVILFDLLGEKVPVFGVGATFFYDMQRLPVLLISVTLFLGFLGLPIKYSRLINVIASAAFGVYLIHDDNLVRPFLWKTLFKDASYAKSNLLIPYSIAVIILVFIVCTLIELFRIYVIETHYMKSVNDLADKIENRTKKFFESNIFKKI